jgi:hypothetical protein
MDIENIGSMLTDEQKADLKAMGEKFYGSIDMEKYKPVPVDEVKGDDLFSEKDILYIKYKQLKVAMNSGLLYEDLTQEELDIYNKFKTD